MTDTRDLRFLFRKQESTGIWIQEHGPFSDALEAQWACQKLTDQHRYVVGICTSEDGRTVITGYDNAVRPPAPPL